MTFPKIFLPKGTIVEIGRGLHVMGWAVGLQLELQEDVDYPLHKYITNGVVLNCPPDALHKSVTHMIRPVDRLIYHPNGQDNASFLSVLRQEE